AAATGVPALEGDERLVGGVRARLEHAIEALHVPAPRAHRVALEVGAGAELGDVARPDGAGGAAAEGGGAGGDADAGAGDHHQPARAEGPQGGGELGSLRGRHGRESRPALRSSGAAAGSGYPWPVMATAPPVQIAAAPPQDWEPGSWQRR